jgi:hypothetical protein
MGRTGRNNGHRLDGRQLLGLALLGALNRAGMATDTRSFRAYMRKHEQMDEETYEGLLDGTLGQDRTGELPYREEMYWAYMGGRFYPIILPDTDDPDEVALLEHIKERYTRVRRAIVERRQGTRLWANVAGSRNLFDVGGD